MIKYFTSIAIKRKYFLNNNVVVLKLYHYNYPKKKNPENKSNLTPPTENPLSCSILNEMLINIFRARYTKIMK